MTDNPFWILQLPLSASAHEIERQGQKLLAMLSVGLDDAGTYPTPLGPQPRGPDDVRRALDQLRDPDRRAAWEATAALAPDSPAPQGMSDRQPAPWPDALTALRWR